jgi:hypothetical protein
VCVAELSVVSLERVAVEFIPNDSFEGIVDTSPITVDTSPISAV